jgi:hypothetical protein
MPWAISLIHDFKVPKEKIKISDAYNFFTMGKFWWPFIMIGTKTTRQQNIDKIQD